MIKQQLIILFLLAFAFSVRANVIIISRNSLFNTKTINLKTNYLAILDTTIQNSDSTLNSIVADTSRSNFNNAKKDIKIDLFGPFRGYTQITYEVSISPLNSLELSLGIIGIGHNGPFEYSDTMNHSGVHNKSQLGLFFGIGYKINKLPLFEFGGTDVHLLQGLYARPMFYVGEYDENRIAYVGNNQYQLLRPTTTFAALQIELGKQWVIKKRAVFDMYMGLGYGIDNKKYYSTSYYDYTTTSSFNYCNDRIGRSPGISFTIGIKTGLLMH